MIRIPHGVPQNAFDAYGQTKALMKTRNGLMLDEDAPKKSLTDAITKAASQIGIAANIFLGRWDDKKYVAQVSQEYKEAKQVKKPVKEDQRDPERITQWFVSEMLQAKTYAEVKEVISEGKAVAAIAWLDRSDTFCTRRA